MLRNHCPLVFLVIAVVPNSPLDLFFERRLSIGRVINMWVVLF